MNARRHASVLASAIILVGCSADVSTRPEAPPGNALVRRNASARLVSSSNLPILAPTGVAIKGLLLYVSTGTGFRDTYVVNRLNNAIVGTIPTGGNPRDVASYNADLLFSDLGGSVIERTVAGTFVSSFALPFRGGGIATDDDTVWVGDFDSNQFYQTANHGVSSYVYASDVRAEGMVFDPSSKTLWVITPFNGDHKLYELSTTGHLIRSCDSPYDPGPYGLGGIALVSDTFFIAEAENGDPTLGTTLLVIDKASLVCNPPLVQSVEIEVRPRDPADPDRVRPSSTGEIPVAILSGNGFDARTVDATSVRFGHAGTEAAPVHVAIRDVDGDGDLDMVLRFNVQDTGILCGDAAAYLTGKTNGGQSIKGSDDIQTKGCKKGKP